MKLVKTLIATAFAFASASAVAVPVTLNVVDGTWSNVTGGKNVEYRDGGKEVRWGGNVHYKDKSGYRFDENPYLPITFDSSETFSLGTFTHYNEPIPTGTAISDATLTVSTELDILGSSITDGPYDFSFDHTETLNNACTGGFLSRLFCALGLLQGTGYVKDIVELDTAIHSNEFVVDSYAFSLEILGFQGIVQSQYKHKTNYTCSASPIVDETLYTQENCATSAEIIARLNVREIPQQVSEPASVALMGISLFGFALLRRRRTA